MSRYHSSSGFNPRDRSPQRFGDRRPPAGPRGSDDANLPIGREPPRAPKALIDPPRGGPFGGRGRGYPGRGGDFRDRDRDPRDRERERDRDFRDIRDGPPPFRRDIDRDWGRRTHDFDPREPRVGFGRGRSRSPPPPRDFRDMREPLGRDPDLARMRRGSRDSLMSVSSLPDGPPSGTGHHPRSGSMRGRGRGDWDGGRGRGRMPYLDDRDSFRRRSRSRDSRWDRDRDRDRERVIDRDRDRERMIVDRDRDRDLDRRDRERERDIDRRERFDRRDELDRRVERDERDRPADITWKRDRPPSRNENRNPSVSSVPSAVAPSVPPGPGPSDRIPDLPGAEHPRKLSGGDSWRDIERPEPLPSAPKDFVPPVTKRSPPPAAPQVPAFGSVTAAIPNLSAEKHPAGVAPTAQPLPKADKERHEAPARPQIQPPTGPKADRGPPQSSLEQRPRRDETKADEGPDSLGRRESIVRTPKQSAALTVAVQKSTELSPPTAPAAMVGREPAMTPESSPTKLGSTISLPDVGRRPSSAGRSASPGSHTSPRMHSPNIPTGPRALQQRPPPPRGTPKGNKQWVRPGYSRPQPGPSPTLPPKRDSIDGKDRNVSLNEDTKRDVKLLVDSQPTGPAVEEPEPVKDTIVLRDKENVPVLEPSTEPQGRAGTPPQLPLEATVTKVGGDHKDVIISDFGRSSDEDEDENVFTQEYLEERKKIFEKDMQALRAELPPQPLEDPNIVALLMRIQLLGMLAHEAVPEKAPTPPAVADEQPIAADEMQLDSTKDDRADGKTEDHEPSTKLVLDSLPDAISIENLPFLNSGPPTPLSDLDVYQENIATHERIKEILRGELMDQRKEIAKKNAALRMDWLSHYKSWRLSVWELDRVKEKSSITPGLTPPPAPSQAVTPTPVAEGRRYKGNSELDFQNALRASEISAQEELERRRENKATAQPDLTREAEIPDMLDEREAKALVYKDTNNIVDPSEAMEVFGFLPPPNDFTPEEHEIFTDAFMAHPKKWGKIAESLPGRDFRQCIVHYYLTKEEIKYKAKLNKRWSRRGRARRSARPKSNALMADLGVVKPDYEGEEEPVPVTDTGRPRRAAAPTFGDSSADTEQSSNNRRGTAVKDSEQSEKPSGRRGARSGTGTRGGRRGKAAQQQQQQTPQTPQEVPKPTAAAAATSTGTSAAGVVPVPTAEAPEPPLEGPGEVRPAEQPERDQFDIPPRSKSGRGRQRDVAYAPEPAEQENLAAATAASARQPDLGYSSPQPSSYWSVPEQRDFPLLLAHFGRDFEGISNFMKTKTTQMVKNYFQRSIDSGKTDFEDIVADAEAKKARGEATGLLPVPNFTSKRRYEATPSAVITPRPLAPHTEAHPEIDDSRAVSNSRPAGPSAPPVPLHARPLHERERSVSRYPPLAQASSAPLASHSPAVALAVAEDASRAIHAQTGLPPRMQGPRMGYFLDERRDIPSTVLTHATPRPHEAPIPARQSALAASEMARIDSLHSQGFRISNMDVHGSPLLPAQNVTAPPHQAYMHSRPQPQAQPPSSLIPGSHARQPSLTQPPGSPVQVLARQEPELSHARRDSISQRSFYPMSGHHAGISQPPQPPPVLPPAKEPSRQVPAKRSNIMNILNDEPEEPQPRKRFASDQASSVPAVTAVSPSRPVYTVTSSLPQPTPSRQEESVASQQKGSVYAQQSPYLPPSRLYSEYPSYSSAQGTAAAAVNNDWMARFDPRGQQQQPSSAPPPPNARPATTLGPQPPYSPYASSQNMSGPILPNLNAPSPVPTPSPAPSQRPSYATSVYASSPAPHAQPAGTGSRDPPSQTPMYRSAIGSPTPRNSSVQYASRPGPPTPIQTSAGALGAGPRQQPPGSSYAATAQTTAGPMHVSGAAQQHATSAQGYQHLQAMVSGGQQQQSHRSSLGLVGAQYGHSTPPPQAQGSRMAPLPGPTSQQMSMGRSYTPPAIGPPAILQSNPAGGVGYGPSGPSGAVGPVHPLQARPPGSNPLSEAVPGPHGTSGHHRVYSQGSNPGPLPGPLPPRHAPR